MSDGMVKWVIPGFLPTGLILLTGAPKIGKSWLALSCAYAVSAGGVALGRFQCEEPAPILFCGLDDSDSRLKSRLEIVAGAPPWPASFEFLTSFGHLMLGMGVEDALEDWIKSRPGAKLVVIDPVGRVRSESRRIARASLRGLHDIAVHYSITVLAIQFDASGIFGLTGTCDGMLSLSRAHGSSDGVLVCSMRDVQDATLDMTFDAGLWRTGP